MRSMKLAIISTHPIQYNAPLFRLLHERGNIQVKVFYTWGEDVLKDKFDPGFGRTITWDIPLLEGYDSEFLRNDAKEPGSHHFYGISNPDLTSTIDQWGADAILVYGWSFKSHLAVIRHYKGRIPVFFRGDSTLLDEQTGIRKFLRRQWLSWVYRHIDIAFYVGTNNRSYFLAHGMREEQLVYAPHAIDNDRFAAGGSHDQSIEAWKHELGILPTDFVLLFCGKFEKKKDPFFLVQLSKHLEQPNLRFLLVGNGELETELKSATQGDRRFIFLGFQNQKEMPLVYRMGDVFVLPSQGPNETWGLAINEAMACGLPVMASDKVGGAIDLIEDYQNGLVFRNNDHTSATKFITWLLEKGDRVKVLGERSFNHVQNFSFSAIADAVEHTCLARHDEARRNGKR